MNFPDTGLSNVTDANLKGVLRNIFKYFEALFVTIIKRMETREDGFPDIVYAAGWAAIAGQGVLERAADGMVVYRIAIQATGAPASNLMCTLPVGFRPPSTTGTIAFVEDNSAALYLAVLLRISSNGEVELRTQLGALPGTFIAAINDTANANIAFLT